MTRSQFLASICAIPFIGKLFKVSSQSRWMRIGIPYTGSDHVLGYPSITVEDFTPNNVPIGTHKDYAFWDTKLTKEEADGLLN